MWGELSQNSTHTTVNYESIMLRQDYFPYALELQLPTHPALLIMNINQSIAERLFYIISWNLKLHV